MLDGKTYQNTSNNIQSTELISALAVLEVMCNKNTKDSSCTVANSLLQKFP